MKKIFKWIGVIVAVFAVLIFGGIGYVTFMLPDVGDAPDLKVALTPERVARGEYLANSVTVCMDCHSKRDWTAYSGPMVPGTIGGGGEKFDRNLGFPGNFYSRNITPAGIGNWTDGELFRAITTGVNKEGEALFPVMPYHYYGKMDKEDIYSIIAYLRTLPAVKTEIPEREIDFPLNIIINTIPQPAAFTHRPDPSDTVAYGGYLVASAGCVECHTKVNDKGQIIAGLEFAGGREFNLPWGVIRTSNITPDASGLGYWSREKFIRTFKQYQDSGYTSPKLTMSDFNTIMPWTMYSRMTESDLASIYAYLKTIPPQKNEVVKFTPAGAVASK